MIDNSDMLQAGYFQGMPGNMVYGNFGYQGPPGSLIAMPSQNMIMDNNPLLDLNARINSLENRVKILEQKLTTSNTTTNPYQEDNSMYML